MVSINRNNRSFFDIVDNPNVSTLVKFHRLTIFLDSNNFYDTRFHSLFPLNLAFTHFRIFEVPEVLNVQMNESEKKKKNQLLLCGIHLKDRKHQNKRKKINLYTFFRG